jgi:release factor glutamine methyltransferase
MITVQNILTDMRNAFRAAGLDTPELDARLLAEAALSLDQTGLITKAQQEITAAQKNTLDDMMQRRLRYEPVSRILGTRAFWKSDFKISPATLDPRADSETLVEAVIKHADKDQALNIIDLGTGTGCLLLSVLQELPQATGTGIDISADAIAIAKENAGALGLAARTNFMSINWDELAPQTPFDMIISNPPYIALTEKENLAPDVRDYDPETALYGGIDGLDCYRDIMRLVPRLLKPHGLIFFEIGATQADAVKGIASQNNIIMLHTYLDLAGHDRCLVARYKPSQ